MCFSLASLLTSTSLSDKVYADVLITKSSDENWHFQDCGKRQESDVTMEM